jgi:hypothetical protein
MNCKGTNLDGLTAVWGGTDEGGLPWEVLDNPVREDENYFILLLPTNILATQRVYYCICELIECIKRVIGSILQPVSYP